jgi:hypothetical protein
MDAMPGEITKERLIWLIEHYASATYPDEWMAEIEAALDEVLGEREQLREALEAVLAEAVTDARGKTVGRKRRTPAARAGLWAALDRARAALTPTPTLSEGDKETDVETDTGARPAAGGSVE